MTASIAHILAAAEAQRRIARREYHRRLDIALDILITDALTYEGSAHRIVKRYKEAGNAKATQ